MRKDYRFDSRVLLEIKKSENYFNNPHDETFLTLATISKK